MTANKPKPYNLDMLRWWLIGMIAPAFMAAFVALILLQKTKMGFDIAMPIMIGAGAIGAAIHYRTYKKPPRTRLMSHGIYAVVLAVAGFVLFQSFAIQHDKLLTCPVCGFHTLEAEGDLCAICNVEVTQYAVEQEDYESMTEYIKAEQMMYFLPADPSLKVDFYAPYTGKEGYQKDKDWKPSVTAEDVKEVQEMAQ